MVSMLVDTHVIVLISLGLTAAASAKSTVTACLAVLSAGAAVAVT